MFSAVEMLSQQKKPAIYKTVGKIKDKFVRLYYEFFTDNGKIAVVQHCYRNAFWYKYIPLHVVRN